MNNFLERFTRDERGVTAIEYALLAGLIATVIVASVTLSGSQLLALFSYISTEVAQAIS